MDEFEIHLPKRLPDPPTWDGLVTRGGREEYTKQAKKKRKRRDKVPTDHRRPE